MKTARFILLSASLLLVIALASAAPAIYAQQPSQDCSLKEAPALRGFRLGMSVLEVRMNLEDKTQFDLSIRASSAPTFTVRITAAELKEALAEGVDEFNLSFVDGKVAVIKLTYNGAMSWDGAGDFLAKESETLGLPKPAGAGSSGSQGNEKYKVACRSFAVTLAYSFGVSPSVTMNDLAAQKLADQRKDKEGEVKRIVIGPGSTTTIPIRRP